METGGCQISSDRDGKGGERSVRIDWRSSQILDGTIGETHVLDVVGVLGIVLEVNLRHFVGGHLVRLSLLACDAFARACRCDGMTSLPNFFRKVKRDIVSASSITATRARWSVSSRPTSFRSRGSISASSAATYPATTRAIPTRHRHRTRMGTTTTTGWIPTFSTTGTQSRRRRGSAGCGKAPRCSRGCWRTTAAISPYDAGWPVSGSWSWAPGSASAA